MKPFFYLLIPCILMISCKGDDEFALSHIPALTVESISPSSVVEFRDSVILVLAYEDGNADLGSEDPDEKTLYVKDSRLTEPDMYHVKPLAPPDANVPIKGTLRIGIRSVFLLGNGTSEQVSFTVKIKDQAGNWSEETVSPTITITR